MKRTEKRTNELESRIIEISQTEQQRKNRLKQTNKQFQEPVRV